MKSVKKNRYKIIPDLELTLQLHIGKNDFDDCKSLKSEIINDQLFCPNFNLIIDIRDAEIDMTPEQLAKYSTFVESIHNPNKKIKIGVLTSNPEHVSSTILFKLNLNSEFLNYKAFSISKALLKWMYNDSFESHILLESIISHEKNK